MKTNFTFIRYSISVLSLVGFCGIPALSRADQADGGPIPGLRGELLYPTRTSVATDKADCAEAFRAYLGQADPADVSGLTGFLEAHANSPYRMGVLTHLGSIYFRTARFSKCIEAYEQAWTIGQGQIDPGASQTAGKAAGELALMYARLGRYDSLEALLKAVEGRTFGGAGPNLLDDARLGFGLMTQDPGISFRCGPMALSRILASQNETLPIPAPIRDSVSTRQGMSLVQTRDIAKQVGLGDFRMARRAPGAAILTPAVVHWKVGHYSALLGKNASGSYRVEDPTFASQTPITISPEALDAEASGYFLVAAKDLPAGWTVVDDLEGAKVFGKGTTGKKDPTGTHSDSPKVGQNEKKKPCPGMASWGVHTSVVSLNIMDTPVGYQPPVGYPVNFTLTYNSRESQEFIPQPITNTGGRWMMNTTAYLSDLDGTGVNVFPGTGARNYYKWNAGTSTYTRDKRGYSQLEKLGQDSYRVTYADGSQELYAYAAWGWDSFSREFFRTSLKDPAGNDTRFEYERVSVPGVLGEWTRLKKIIDAIGGETVFQYTGNNLDPSRVTDPFGRFAEFEYDGDGHLILIRDVIGIESRFRYQGVSDLIEALITPYGETRFEYGEVGTTRWLQATHPNGDHERVEFRHYVEGISRTLPQLPTGVLATNNWYDARNALYWDRKAMKEAPGDVNAAHITHFLHTQDVNVSADLIESEKSPLEGRVFYNYRGQTSEWYVPPSADTRVSKVARLLDDGSTQLSQFEYNDFGKLTKTVDPLGRTTDFIYAPNQIDLLEIRQKTGAATYDVLATFTYNPQHQPLTMTDSGGHVTTATYNARGQALTVVNARGETLTFEYDTNFRLIAINGPIPGASDRLGFTYDSFGRAATTTDGSGLSLAFAYDGLDRLTRRTYSDGSADEWTYEAMNLKTFRSRGGDSAAFSFNSLGENTAATDGNGRTTLMEWCRCGGLSKLIDPLGQMTRFSYDVQGRPTSKATADGRSISLQYEAVSGRMARVIDEDGKEQQFTYGLDNLIVTMASGGTAPTEVLGTFAWDAIYQRLTGFSDPSGATALTYFPVAPNQLGAGQLASVDGPLANDSIGYTYDVLGRVTSQGIGSGNTETQTYDVLGRVTSVVNPLGTFGFDYDGSSLRVASATYPNGPSSQFTYLPASGLGLLSQIQHTKSDNTSLSSFSMAYNGRLQINSITRGIDAAPPVADVASYDAFARLSGFQKGLADGGTKTFGYTYDAADNRLTETVNGAGVGFSVNAVNQITATEPPVETPRTYEWDAAGRLIGINIDTHRSEFTYDALSRRVRLVEKENGSTVQDRRFVFNGFEAVEERNSSGAVIKRFMRHGFQSAGTSYFYTRDHLGSIREVCDASGALVARFDYDPFGRRSQIYGNLITDFGFSGHFAHEPSGLILTHGRAYDPTLGRWISRDPAGEGVGLNLYAYVNNDPLNFVDRNGFEPDYYGAAGSFVQALGGAASAGLGIGAMLGAGTAAVAIGGAAAPVVAGSIIIAGGGMFTYNALNAFINLGQGILKLGGSGPILGAGGSEFQFNPITEGLHFLGFGGDCAPYQEVTVLGLGIAFDTVAGNKVTAGLQGVAMTGKVAAIGGRLGHAGSVVNMTPAVGGAATSATQGIGSGYHPYISPSAGSRPGQFEAR